MLDSNDRQRLQEATDDLNRILKDDELKNCPILVFANKQDISTSMNRVELVSLLKLHTFRQKWYVQSCCAITGLGLSDGLEWAIQTVEKAVDFPKLLINHKKYTHFGRVSSW